MSYGPPDNKPMPPLVTIRPGPVLHVWANGAEFIQVPLTWQSALSLAADLILQARIMPGPNNLPRENLSLEAHMADRDNQRGQTK